MKSFAWSAQYETGLDQIDEQHRKLVDLINQFADLLVQGTGNTPEKLDAIFSDLADYASLHFRDEELFMEQARLDPRYLAHHKANHADFAGEISQRYQRVSPDDPETAERLLGYLINWLAYHILGTDKAMVAQVRKIAAGEAPERVYETFLAGMGDSAVDPLLSALNGLFHEVCERNRELLELNQTLEAKVAERTLELMNANKYLEELALTDMLTGLPNRRHAMLRLAEFWRESTATQTPLACLLLDADGFKQVNDTHGHDAGDEVLRHLARELKNSVRTDDIVSRLGGDEFLVILPMTPLEGAHIVAETIRSQVSALRVPVGRGQWIGSVSVGLATRQPTMAKFEDLITLADEGVYVAKRNGRNCVGVAWASGAIQNDARTS